MRDHYRGELEEIVTQLGDMADSVHSAIKDATRSLMEANLTLAERVISGDTRIDAMHDQLELASFTLLARQSPVAGELRTIVAAMRIIAALGRMGDLAAHVAKIARLRYPECAVSPRLTDSFVQMSDVALDMIGTVRRTLADRDVDAALALAEEDELMDELRADQFRILLADDWSDGVEAAVDAALLGRYYERMADHTVAIGRRIVYLITGEAPEGENWPVT